jgi:Cu+-exporting ATPase
MSDHVRLPIEGMTCTSCASRIIRAVRRLDGVESVKVDLGSDSCAVAFDPEVTSLVAIASAVRQAGYEARIDHAEPFTPSASLGLLARLGLGR